jgi:hypothetical protein
VSGVFRRREQVVDLTSVSDVRHEAVLDTSGTRRVTRHYVYVETGTGRHLMNDPAKVYLDQRPLGRLLSEALGVPFREA